MRRDFDGLHLTCSFCGKNKTEVRKLIAGPTVYICDECIRLCSDIINEESEFETKGEEEARLLTPQEMTERLNEYVIGQQRAKKIISVAVYNHYKRIRDKTEKESKGHYDDGHGSSSGDFETEPEHDEDSIELSKSNVLLVGPTGSGKTFLAQTLSKLLKVPFIIADATTLTEAGYVGEDVENILTNLLVAADNDISKAERGIIYIDEIDKISRKGESISVTRDVSGEGVQQALLKIIEGTVANVTPRGSKRYPAPETVQINTKDILVICGGSFVGIEHIIKQRIGKKELGFGVSFPSDDSSYNDETLCAIEPEDLQAYGLIPEFVGRLPVIVSFDDLNKDDLIRILVEPKNALTRQYQALFAMENVELEFDKEAITVVSELALQNNTGARGLRSILETAMLDVMYDVPFIEGIKKCRITKNVILDNEAPIVTYHEKKTA